MGLTHTDNMETKINDVYVEKSVVQTSRIQTENREIPLYHYVDKNGNVTIVVNGSKLSDLLNEPLFKNTFSVFGDNINNPEKTN